MRWRQKEAYEREKICSQLIRSFSISREEAEEFAERLEQDYPDLEVEINEGGQPIYYYIVSVE